MNEEPKTRKEEREIGRIRKALLAAGLLTEEKVRRLA